MSNAKSSSNISKYQRLNLDLPIKLVSKSNYRQGNNAGWRKYKGFEEELIIEIQQQIPLEWTLSKDNYFYLVEIKAKSKIDAGNFSKSVLDALEGIVYENDNQVKVCIAINTTDEENNLHNNYINDKFNLVLVRAEKKNFNTSDALTFRFTNL